MMVMINAFYATPSLSLHEPLLQPPDFSSAMLLHSRRQQHVLWYLLLTTTLRLLLLRIFPRLRHSRRQRLTPLHQFCTQRRSIPRSYAHPTSALQYPKYFSANDSVRPTIHPLILPLDQQHTLGHKPQIIQRLLPPGAIPHPRSLPTTDGSVVGRRNDSRSVRVGLFRGS